MATLPSWDDALKGAQAPPTPTPTQPSWDDTVKAAAPPAPAPPPSQTSSYDPNWKPPAPTGHPLWDAVNNFMWRPIAKTEDPFSAIQDYGLGIGDYATGGLVGKALGKNVQDAIAQAHQNLGMMDYAAQGIGYAAGPGKVLSPLARGIVARAAPAAAMAATPVSTMLGSYAAPVGARVASAASGALENAGAAALGTYGHEQGWTPDMGEIGKNAGAGAMIGALTGATGTSPTAKGPTAAEVGEPGRSGGAPTGMVAQREAGYAPLDSIYFDRSTANSAASQGLNTIKSTRDPQGYGADLGISPQVDGIMSNLVKAPVTTGRNLQEASRALRQEGSWQANQYANQLDSALKNAQPISGGVVGDAAAAKATGDMWHQRIEDLNRLGADPGELTSSAIKQTQAFPSNQANPAIKQSLNDLSASMKPGFNWWTARHVAAPLAGAAAGTAEGYFNAAEGQDPWTNAGIHAGEDALLFGGLHSAATPRPQAALNAARYAIATGKPLTTPAGRVGDWLMNLAGGSAISGQGATAPYQNTQANQP
jgi:hypothetical protein